MSELPQVPMAVEVAPACAGPWNRGSIGLTGMRRVRADLNPRVLPWIALVSADDLSGF